MRYDAELRRLGRVDAEQRTVRALDALRERPSLWGATPVLFYGFDDLTTLQLDTIETLGAIVDAPVTVSLAYEPGRFAFAGRAATFMRSRRWPASTANCARAPSTTRRRPAPR